MSIRPFTVSRAFREFAFKLYPGLHLDQAYPCLLQTMLCPSFVDRETGNSIHRFGDLATIQGKQHQLSSRNYRGWEFIDQYRHDTGHHVEFLPHNHVNGRARMVSNLQLDPRLAVALEQELQTVPSEPVDFVTGRKYIPRHTVEQRKEDLRMAKQHPSKYVETQNAIDYMNNVPPYRARKAMDAHGEEAVLAAYRMQERGKSNQDLVTLRFMRDQPKQFFTASERNRSRRLFPAHPGLGTLSKEIATIVGQDRYEFDLRYSQFAICAYLWNVPEVIAFLESGANLWDELYGYFNLDERAKPALKKGTYGLHYGAGQGRIAKEIRSKIMDALLDDENALNLSSTFLTYPLMVAIRKGRDAQLKRIRADDGAYDCYGEWVAVPLDPDKRGNLSPNPRSVLATLAQAVEFSILSPVFDLARGTKDFYITHFAHDGFCLDFTDHRRAESWIRRITEAVNAQAEKLGICTILEQTRTPAQ